MRNTTLDARPKMLMLAHCLPAAIGSRESVRIWQLLKIVSKTHRVTLVCTDNSNIHLSHWRQLSDMTEKLVIEKFPRTASITSKVVRMLNAPRADRLKLTATMRLMLHNVTANGPFDILLCTHPALWSRKLKPLAKTVICDLAKPRSIEHLIKSHTASPFTQWWHRNQSCNYLAAEKKTSRNCDIITLADDDHWQKINDNRCKAIVIPQQIDVNQLNYVSQNLATQKTKYLVLHADFKDKQSRREVAWFKREIWPTIKARVKDVKLSITDPRSNPNPGAAVETATVIVCPSSSSHAAHLPILQTMAAGKPVIASAAGAEGLSVKSGKHIQLAWSVDDWKNMCIELLGSATLREQLATQGRQHIKENHSLDHQPQDLLQYPDIVVKPIGSLAHAA